MTARAYILIETSVGKTSQVAESLAKIDGILSVDVVTGPYDVIACIEASDIASIGNLVTENMHLNGVQRTVTCISVGRN